MTALLTFTGCSNYNDSNTETMQQDVEKSAETDSTSEKFSEAESPEPTITEIDWSDYFGGLNGAAVIYDPTEENYMIYNKELILRETLRKEVFSLLLL